MIENKEVGGLRNLAFQFGFALDLGALERNITFSIGWPANPVACRDADSLVESMRNFTQISGGN